jgi:ArsR family transcriptional regulator
LNVLKEAGFLKDRKQGRWTNYSIDDSDFFRRFLLVSVLERIPKEGLAEDRKRLADFMQDKPARDNVVAIRDTKRCAGRCK